VPINTHRTTTIATTTVTMVAGTAPTMMTTTTTTGARIDMILLLRSSRYEGYSAGPYGFDAYDVVDRSIGSGLAAFPRNDD